MTEVERDLVRVLQERTDNYLKYMEDMEFRKAMNELRAIWVEGNNYISTTEPWMVIKENPERAAAILRVCINLIRIFAVLSYPVMPARCGADAGASEPQACRYARSERVQHREGNCCFAARTWVYGRRRFV